MKMGVWTPLPHTVRREPRMETVIATLGRRGEGAGEENGLQLAIETLQEAERLGFEKTLIAERFLGPDLEAWMLAAALATQTRSIELMVAVHPGIVPPAVAAKMAATLDRISGGRAAVNIVNGWWREEFEMFGCEPWLDRSDDRYARMDEYMEVLVRLWTGDRSDFAGRFYCLKDPQLPSTPVTRPYPPIYTASMSPIGQASVARIGDHWFATPRTMTLTYRDFDQVLAEVGEAIAEVREMAAKHGRTLGYGLAAHVHCCGSQAEADAYVVGIERYGQEGVMNRFIARAASYGLIGTPELIAERLRLYEAAGIDFTMLSFHPVIEGMRSFARQVLPLV